MRAQRARTAALVALVGPLVAALPAEASSDLRWRIDALRGSLSSRSRPPPRVPTDCASRDAWRARAASDPQRLERAVRDASLRFGVDAALIRSVIRHESNFDAGAVSHVGARGLMQLMPGTASELGVDCAFDPRENVMGGTRYLRELRDRFGSWACALAGYHAGPRRVESGSLPAETRRYVARVLASWRPQSARRACGPPWVRRAR